MKLLADILGGIVGIFALYYLYNSFLTPKKSEKRFVILIYAITAVYGMIYPMFASTPISRSVCTFIFVLFPLCLYKGTFSFKIIMIIMFYIILGFCIFICILFYFIYLFWIRERFIVGPNKENW